jgi:L-aspartate oxidase
VAVQTEVLVVGSGIAGLICALECAKTGPVAIVTKDRLPESSSQYAQGGIASVWSPEDSFESHVDDTLLAGAGLCHRDVVETVVREGPARVRDLIALGTNFDLRGTGAMEDREYDLGREGGHSHRRILHALDATGHEIIRALTEAVRAHPEITIYENHLAVDLLVSRSEREPECWGAYVLDRATRQVHRFTARATSAAAAPGRCTSTRPTPTSRRVTAWRWRIAPARPSRTWSSSSSIRRASSTPKRSRSS